MTRADRTSPTFYGYAAGNGGIAILRQIIVFMPLYFYSPPTGRGIEFLSARSVGLALFIARIIDVVSDPLIGWVSDRTRHPWGKRLPYIVFGTPLWILATLLIFLPPGAQTGSLNFFWLTATASLFFVGMTAVQVPYLAILPEIARTEETAIRVSARMGKCFIGGALIAMSGGWFVGMRFGFFRAVLLCAGLAGLLLALAIRELFAVKQHPRPVRRDRFFASAWTVIREKPFWTYLFGYSLFVCGYYTILVASPYFITEIVGLPGTLVGVFFLLPMLTAIAVAPIAERAALRFGKKKTMLTAMLMMMSLALSWTILSAPSDPSGTALADLLPWATPWAEHVKASLFFRALLLFALVGLPVSVQLLFQPAIVADLVAYDTLKTGHNRESLVYGLQGGIEKNAVMIATLAASLSLERGKDMANVVGIRHVGLVAAVMIVVGGLIFAHYPLAKGWRKA